MPDIIITVAYRMSVVPEWYDPNVLSGNGTLKEQVCEYEKSRVERDSLYVGELKRDKIEVEFAPEVLEAWCGDVQRHSRHKFIVTHETQHFELWVMCIGKPIPVDVLTVEEDLMTPGMPNPCQPIGCDNGYHLPGCVFADIDSEQEAEDTCIYCLSKTCPGSCKESMADAPNPED